MSFKLPPSHAATGCLEDRGSGPEEPDLGAEPLSARDIQEIVVPLEFQPAPDSEPVESCEPLSVRDLELTEVAPESDVEALSLRDVEELTERPPVWEAQGFPSGKRLEPPPLPQRSVQPGLAGPAVMASSLPKVSTGTARALVPVMLDRLAESDFEAAFAAAGTVLRNDPTMPDALQAAQIARVELYRIYGERLGSRDRIPKLVVRLEDLRLYPLDACAALVLSQVDGVRSIEAVIGSGVLPKLDALRVLSELYLRGLISLS